MAMSAHHDQVHLFLFGKVNDDMGCGPCLLMCANVPALLLREYPNRVLNAVSLFTVIGLYQ